MNKFEEATAALTPIQARLHEVQTQRQHIRAIYAALAPLHNPTNPHLDNPRAGLIREVLALEESPLRAEAEALMNQLHEARGRVASAQSAPAPEAA
jgi:hypothetical protein